MLISLLLSLRPWLRVKMNKSLLKHHYNKNLELFSIFLKKNLLNFTNYLSISIKLFSSFFIIIFGSIMNRLKSFTFQLKLLNIIVMLIFSGKESIYWWQYPYLFAIASSSSISYLNVLSKASN